MTNYCIIALSLFLSTGILGQQTITLDEVLEQTKLNAFTIKEAESAIGLAHSSQDFFKASLKPQIGLNLQAPSYLNTSSAIIQPNGSISFTDVSQNNASFNIGVNQVVGLTGGTIFASTNLRRFDDFSNKITSYNGSPFIIGISQPILGFNPYKYDKKITTLRLKEITKAYNIKVEEALVEATKLYFDILVASENKKIAQTNKTVNEKLLKITEERFILGKVSNDEKLQLQIELNNAELNELNSNFQYDQAVLRLSTLLGIRSNTDFEYATPTTLSQASIDEALAVSKAISNRPEFITFQRQKAELERDLSSTKTQYGLQANVTASFGYVRGATNVTDIYADPIKSNQVSLTVDVPIVDWGRKKAALTQIRINQDLLLLQEKQQLIEFENQVRSVVLQLQQLQQEIKLLETMKINAEERFKISNERYVLGNISITDLTLAQREKDQIQRNYISSLSRYWITYYQIRMTTGYDFTTNSDIIYTINQDLNN